MGWITNNIVQPVVDELLKPENLAKIAEVLAPAVLDGVSAQGDRIVAEITQDSTQATKVIDAVSSNTEAVGKGLADNVNNMGATLTTEINNVVSGLFDNIKNLLPHIPGLGEPNKPTENLIDRVKPPDAPEPPRRPRGRR